MGRPSDISPRSTFSSWGISSMDNRRSIFPTGVSRGSSRILNTGPVASLNSSNRCCWASASATMVRNLYILNLRLFSPYRSWMNKIGPGLVTLIASALSSNNGADANQCEDRQRYVQASLHDQPAIVRRGVGRNGGERLTHC